MDIAFVSKLSIIHVIAFCNLVILNDLNVTNAMKGYSTTCAGNLLIKAE